MGPPDLRTLVTRQTDQITLLTSQLEASLTRNARLSARVFTALDTIDSLHAELDSERRKNDKYLWMNLIQELQREKEGLKEAIEFLVREVEKSKGNFDRWPSATMYLPIPAGRSTRLMDPAPLAVVSPRMETLLHALTVERSRVRRATESLQNAYETISTLEAQLARREAELESRDHQCITDVKPVPNRSSSFGSVHPNFLEVPISEIVHLSSIAEEQNYILEQEVSELSDRRLRNMHPPRFTSAAVQTSPVESGTPHSLPCSPPATPARTGRSLREDENYIELKARIDILSDAINNFTMEKQTIRGTLGSGGKPTDTGSDPLVVSPPSALDHCGASPIPHSPPQYQLPAGSAEPPSLQPLFHKTIPGFQRILRLEQECLRLTHTNERLERELAEVRATISPKSRGSSISFIRSPVLRSPPLPTVSPSGFSVRSSGEKDMDISTPLRSSSSLPNNRLSDFDFFLGRAQPPGPDNASMDAEPPGEDTINRDSQEAGINHSGTRPSSALEIDNTHPSRLLSPFQLSVTLPPRSKSAEPPSGLQERISET